MPERIIFLDGMYLKKDDTFIQAFAPGNLRARGVFETLRAARGKVFDLTEHLGRLAEGIKIFKLQLPWSLAELQKAVQTTSRKNILAQARVRVLVWRCQEQCAHCLVTVLPYQPFSRRKYRQGFSVLLVRTNRAPTARFASLKALENPAVFGASRKAQTQGFDDALLVNQSGEIFEAGRANIFVVRDGVVLTPPLRSGCLNGITRRAVFSIAHRRKIPIREQRLTAPQVLSSPEAFLTNSMLGVMPLAHLNRRPIGDGRPGPITELFMKIYCQSRLAL